MARIYMLVNVTTVGPQLEAVLERQAMSVEIASSMLCEAHWELNTHGTVTRKDAERSLALLPMHLCLGGVQMSEVNGAGVNAQAAETCTLVTHTA